MIKLRQQDIIQTLIAKGVFDLKNGNAILSFNNDGELMNIKIEQNVYRKKK